MASPKEHVERSDDQSHDAEGEKPRTVGALPEKGNRLENQARRSQQEQRPRIQPPGTQTQQGRIAGDRQAYDSPSRSTVKYGREVVQNARDRPFTLTKSASCPNRFSSSQISASKVPEDRALFVPQSTKPSRNPQKCGNSPQQTKPATENSCPTKRMRRREYLSTKTPEGTSRTMAVAAQTVKQPRDLHEFLQPGEAVHAKKEGLHSPHSTGCGALMSNPSLLTMLPVGADGLFL